MSSGAIMAEVLAAAFAAPTVPLAVGGEIDGGVHVAFAARLNSRIADC